MCDPSRIPCSGKQFPRLKAEEKARERPVSDLAEEVQALRNQADDKQKIVNRLSEVGSALSQSATTSSNMGCVKVYLSTRGTCWSQVCETQILSQSAGATPCVMAR